MNYVCTTVDASTTNCTATTTVAMTDYSLDFGIAILIVILSIAFCSYFFNSISDKAHTINSELK